MIDLHRPQPATGVPLLDARPEIIEEMRKLLGRAPELQGLVRGWTAAGSGAD